MAWVDTELPVIRPESATELWVQIRDQLAERILDGRIPGDTRIWSQEVLAEDLGVSRGTTIRAYEALGEAGLVIFVRGKGYHTVTDAELAKIRKREGTAGRRSST